MDSFPPNSRKAETRVVEKDIARVTSATARRRRQPLGRKFKNVFFGGDARTAADYMIGNVLIPAAKEAIVEAASSGFEKLVYGDARPRRGSRMGAPQSGPMGYVNYQQRSQAPQVGPPQQPNRLARRGRARHDFDDIIINTRQEAEEVLERLYDALDKYDSVSVADLYMLTGLKSEHTDYKWGWRSLAGAHVGRVRSGGYLIELPEPEFLES